jgi:hypothetical protein
MSEQEPQADDSPTPIESKEPQAIPDTVGGRIFAGCFVFLAGYVGIFALLFMLAPAILPGNSEVVKQVHGVLVVLALVFAIYIATRP